MLHICLKNICLLRKKISYWSIKKIFSDKTGFEDLRLKIPTSAHYQINACATKDIKKFFVISFQSEEDVYESGSNILGPKLLEPRFPDYWNSENNRFNDEPYMIYDSAENENNQDLAKNEISYEELANNDKFDLDFAKNEKFDQDFAENEN